MMKTEARARRAEDMFFDEFSQGLAWIDSRGLILDCNPKFRALFELTSGQLLGHPAHRLFAGCLPGSLNAQAVGGKTLRLQGLKRDGTLVGLEANLIPAEAWADSFGDLLMLRDLREQDGLERRLLQIAEQERQAIGRELHDALGQNLVAMAFMADELSNRWNDATSRQGGAEAAQRLAGLCRETSALMRGLVHGLFPAGLPKGDLASALRGLADFCAVYQVECQARCQRLAIQPETAEQLFRVAQESVTNALRHAQCTRIILGLQKVRNAVVLTVEDNGRGIKATDLQRPGSGIYSMRHRCRLIGARISVTNHGRGTCVTVRSATG